MTREIALNIKRRGVEMRLIIGNEPAPAATVDQNLLREVARAHRCFNAIATGRVSSIGELSARERTDERAI